jgi:LEA14-like dessication related protein
MSLRRKIRDSRLWVGSVVLLFLAGCAQIQDSGLIKSPTVAIADVSLGELNFEQATLNIALEVDNPNPLGASVLGYEYSLKSDGKTLFSGEESRRQALEAKGTSSISLPISLKYADLGGILGSISGRDSISYEFQSNFRVGVAGLSSVIPVTDKGEIPLLRPPNLRFIGVTKKKLSLKGAELVAQVELENPNSIDFGLGDFQYDFSVNDLQWAKGSLNSPASLKSGSKALLSFPVSLNFLSAGSALYQIIQGRDHATFELNAGIQLEGSGPFKDVFLPIQKSGELKLY